VFTHDGVDELTEFKGLHRSMFERDGKFPGVWAEVVLVVLWRGVVRAVRGRYLCSYSS